MRKVTVVHSLPVWLPLTSTWLWSQIKSLPSSVENHVVCEVTAHLNQFPIPNIHALSQAPRWRYYLDKGLRKAGIRRYLGLLTQVAKKYGASIVHSHWGNVAWCDIGAVQLAGSKHVVTFYGKDVNYFPNADPRWRRRYLDLFNRVDLVLCEGPHMAHCIEALGCPVEKLRVQHLGVECDAIPFRPRQWQPGQPLKVLIAASFREKKGIPYALEALGMFRQEVENLQITIIGDASDDVRSHVEKKNILRILKRRNLESNARLLGYQPYAALLREAYAHHIFMSPSVTASDGDTEGGAPVSLIDFAATGMPIISTVHCDIPEIIDSGKTGLLAKERDVEGLLEHLRWWVAHPEKWYEMLALGRKKIEEEFNAAVQARRLYALYASLLDAPSLLVATTDCEKG